MAGSPFRHTVRTRFNEIDVQGRVFNAHWMTYFDEAFAEFIASLGQPVEDSELMHSVLVKSTIEWKGTARYRDDISIVVTASRIGNSSFDLRFDAAVRDEPVCTATNTYVNVDADTGRSRPLSDGLRHLLEGATT